MSGILVINAAARYEGLREVSPNSGEVIERWQREAEDSLGYPRGTYARAPWCAIFARAMYKEAGVEIDSMLVHPYTGYICDRADELNLWLPSGALAPPASLFLFCDVHVGLVVRDRGNGIIDTIEGNSNDMVRRVVRDKNSGRIAVPPGLDSPAPVIMAKRDSYGFDDMNIRPKTKGPWSRQQSRDELLKSFARKNPDQWVAPVTLVRDDKMVYAFRHNKKGTYGDTWRFGGWPSIEARKQEMAAYAKRVNHNNLRTWRRTLPMPIESDQIERDSKTT